MAITLGKIYIDDNWEVNDLQHMEGDVTVRLKRNDDENFTNHDGGFTQSLMDKLVIKLIEQVTGEFPIMKDNGRLFIPVSRENEYWVEISKQGNDWVIEVGEAAA